MRRWLKVSDYDGALAAILLVLGIVAVIAVVWCVWIVSVLICTTLGWIALDSNAVVAVAVVICALIGSIKS